jgi:6-phosphogluconolactonase
VTQWSAFTDADAVARAAADFISQRAHEAIARRGQFKLVLAGGTTPLACYRLLAAQNEDWQNWILFYGDERCLPEQDAQRNHRLVMATGLTEGVDRHYVIPAELGPTNAARAYQDTLSSALPFDLVLLGMGEDGHTASLFPGRDLDADGAHLSVAVTQSPKPPPERVSLTLHALQNCRDMLLLVSGDNKRDALMRWNSTPQLPVARVTDLAQATIFVERSLLRDLPITTNQSANSP